VVPKDWPTFVNDITLKTFVNDELRQHTPASEMIKPPAEIMEWILAVGHEPNWKFKGEDVPLFKGQHFTSQQNLVSGTPAGVIYNTPGWGNRIWKSMKWVATLSFLDSDPVTYVLEEYIRDSLEDDRFLQAGDSVNLQATYLGSIVVEVTE
jgi:2-keto-4-pentenoate hydratase/2-oxohepta-3-ene-1,7-dioic acid hydratase in catechol pathway